MLLKAHVSMCSHITGGRGHKERELPRHRLGAHCHSLGTHTAQECGGLGGRASRTTEDPQEAGEERLLVLLLLGRAGGAGSRARGMHAGCTDTRTVGQWAGPTLALPLPWEGGLTTVTENRRSAVTPPSSKCCEEGTTLGSQVRDVVGWPCLGFLATELAWAPLGPHSKQILTTPCGPRRWQSRSWGLEAWA